MLNRKISALAGMQNDTATVEDNMEIPQKIKHKMTI